MKPQASPLRWIRAWVLGGSSVVLATAGHIVGGGHLEPVLVGLLFGVTGLSAFGWLRRERGLLAITGAVAVLQILAHLAFSVGHPHGLSPSMLAGHAAAALLLAVFLRSGEARAYAVARRRYLQWATAVRCAIAGLSPTPRWHMNLVPGEAVAVSTWIHRVGSGRGPPVAACC